MDRRIQDELDVIKNIIINTIPVEKIILFGSYANSAPHADSDLDIYVVMKEWANIREIDAMKLIRKAIRDKKTFPVDVVVSKQNKFHNRQCSPTLEKEIVKDGIVLYE